MINFNGVFYEAFFIFHHNFFLFHFQFPQAYTERREKEGNFLQCGWGEKML